MPVPGSKIITPKRRVDSRAWLDTRNHGALLQASEFARSIQHRQDLLIGCLEEFAYTKGLINENNLRNLPERYDKTAYGRYLLRLVEEI